MLFESSLLTQEESFDDSHAVTLWAAGSGAVGRELKQGEIIGGSYRLKSLLGKGGMGYVFCAEHIMIKRDYALKLLAAERLNESSRRRFESEGKAIANLDHENIVKVYNMGIDRGDCPFYVMELLDGAPLSDFIADQPGLSFDDCLDIFSQIASGLSYAHSKGIIHRDVKPSNVVLLTLDNGRVQAKIVDFGIAKLLPAAGIEGQSQTVPGEVFGSPYYMSPEQCMGNNVDARSDIYSLGCSLFEALTGRPPYRGGNVLETVMMHQSAAVPSAVALRPDKKLPAAVDALLSRMMAKRPADRYQSMQQLGHDLQRLRDGLPIGKSGGGAGSENEAPYEVESGPSSGAVFGRGALLLALVVCMFVGGGVGLLSFRAWQKRPLPASVLSITDGSAPGPVQPAGAEIVPAIDGAGLVDTPLAKDDNKRNFSQAEIEEARRVFATCPTIVSRTLSTSAGSQRRVNFPKIPLGEVSTWRNDEQKAAGTVLVRDCDVGLAVKADEYISIQAPIIFSRFAPDVLQTLRLTGKRYGVAYLPATFPQEQTANLVTILEYVSHWTNLKHLSLNAFVVNDKVMTAVSMLPRLEQLELHALKWQVSPEQSMTWFGRLQELQLDRMKNAGKLCSYLAGSKFLCKLKLDDSEIRPEEFAVLASCPYLKSVELANINVSDGLVDALIRMPSVEFLNLKTVTLTPGQLRSLGRCGHLRSVTLYQPLYAEKLRLEFAQYPNLQFDGPGKKL
ncbi:MAG: protein kinase [Cyanobacteria bacterium SZAS LIN-3]|nr:protein kinase [Cyanobacteria bacterium SZAS LIN-3]MBS2005972.1 protein kinase [Cyanobacteria bacterium SZAS TMP-1]